MENKINELNEFQQKVFKMIQDIKNTVQEIRTTQKGYMSDAQANDIATKLVDTIENDPVQYFMPDNFEFDIVNSDKIEVCDCDIRVEDNGLLHDDIVETLLDYYGEPKPEPPKDIPVQFNSVAEDNQAILNAEDPNYLTGALAK